MGGEENPLLPLKYDREEMPMRRHKTVIFLTLGFLIGICILLYPAFSDFWNSKIQSRAITNYESVLEKLKPEDYTAIFDKAHAYNKALSETDSFLLQS